MTEIEQPQDDLVEEVLAHLEEWLFEKPEVVSFSAEYMALRINVEAMYGGELADVAEAFVRYNWGLRDLDLERRTLTVHGKMSKTPYLDERLESISTE